MFLIATFIVLICATAFAHPVASPLPVPSPVLEPPEAPIADKSIKLAELVATRSGRKLYGFDDNDNDPAAFLAIREKALQASANAANAGPPSLLQDQSRRRRQAPHVVTQEAAVAIANAAPPRDEIQKAREEYRNRLEGSALSIALALSKAKPQAVDPSGSYAGRRKRQVPSSPSNSQLSETELSEIEKARQEYRDRLKGSALATALALSKAKPQAVDPSGAYAG